MVLLAAFLAPIGTIQTAPILIAFIAEYLTLEGVKYLIQSRRRRQSRTAAAKQTAAQRHARG